MTKDKEHNNRVSQELRDVGATGYGAIKFASRYLPNIIHPDEHIQAAVYGRYKEGGALLSFASGMLVATDRRVFFLDHKPGYTSTDEITYDIVTGVKKTSSSFASSVTLHTRVGDYSVRFANPTGVDKFVQYIETRRLEKGSDGNPIAQATNQKVDGIELAAIKFLKEHEVGVLSTVERTGAVHGATIYYFLDDQDRICMVTKAGTQKARDIFANQQVALTVFDASKAQTVQLSGLAAVVTDVETQQKIMNTLVRLRSYEGEMRLPPVTTIHEEAFVAIRITPTSARFSDYKQRS